MCQKLSSVKLPNLDEFVFVKMASFLIDKNDKINKSMQNH